MKKIVQVGETLRLYLSYQDIDTGLSVDPIEISANIIDPLGVILSVVYPSNDFVRASEGEYFIRVLTTMDGTYTYRITAQTSPFDIDIRDGKFDAELS